MVPNSHAGLLLGLCGCQLYYQLGHVPDNLVDPVSSTSHGTCTTLTPNRTFPIHTMTPIWIFPAYPALLLAPLASNIISSLPDSAAAERINAVAIAYGAVCVQGTGFMVSLMIYSAFIYRLMTQKLPREKSRPGMVSF